MFTSRAISPGNTTRERNLKVCCPISRCLEADQFLRWEEVIKLFFELLLVNSMPWHKSHQCRVDIQSYDRWLVNIVFPLFLSTGLMVGGQWPVTGGLVLPSGPRTLGVGTLMGLPPGSRAIWGSVPIISSYLTSQTRLTIFFFLDMTHFSKRVLLLSARLQTESDHKLHVEHVDSLEQEQLIH